jgi:arginyl-tRNA synthetase
VHMGPPAAVLSGMVSKSLSIAFGELGEAAEPMIFPAKAEFGDYQCNAALPLGKKLKKQPREVAELLMNSINEHSNGVISSMDISGPGFINIKLSDTYITHKLNAMVSDESGRLAISPRKERKRIVVDFSSPNIAKEMHVGHLRSTIIGDSLSRLLAFLGHDVVRLNHVGDWGTQFGMLITYLKEEDKSSLSSSVSDLVSFYRNAKKRFDEDDDFKARSREEVVRLQSGDEESLSKWRHICETSRREFQKIYEILNIEGLEERGESFYNNDLEQVVDLYTKINVAEVSEGALCIFLPGYMNSDGTPLPMIIRKSDGGYLYATTDLAAVRHRISSEKADRVIYVTDVGQSQHFKMVFEAALMGGLVQPEDHSLEHVPFGLVQGEDGKKFKTRSGDTVRLQDLLDEAVTTSAALISEREGTSVEELTDKQKNIARVVGIGAVKYADLSMNRESNYRFSFKKMLSLQGNTAPYMLYAYARIQGIRRKALSAGGSGTGTAVKVNNGTLLMPEELALAKHLLKLEEVLTEVERNLYPNTLCEYLFELSSLFNKFYERCPVIKAESPELVASRTALCSLSADALQVSLGLLGIEVLEEL